MVTFEVSNEKLGRVAAALVELGLGLHELAREARGVGEEDAVERLWNRLGVDTQKFLYELAVDFSPEEPFDLRAVAERLGIAPASARARLMAIGRSARALGGGAPRLWASERDPQTRRRRYMWSPTAHEAVIRLVEG